MDYIVYRKNGWNEDSWYMVFRGTKETATREANRMAAEWTNAGMKAPVFKVCYNGTRSEEVYRTS